MIFNTDLNIINKLLLMILILINELINVLIFNVRIQFFQILYMFSKYVTFVTYIWERTLNI